MTTKDQSPTEHQPLLLGNGFRQGLDQIGRGRVPGLRRTVRIIGIMVGGCPRTTAGRWRAI